MVLLLRLQLAKLSTEMMIRIADTTINSSGKIEIFGRYEMPIFRAKHYFDVFRKQELRELKVLQKQEQKQFQDLSIKTQNAKELQVIYRDLLFTH